MLWTRTKHAYVSAECVDATQVRMDGPFVVDTHRPGIFRSTSVAPQSDDVPFRSVLWSWGELEAKPVGLGDTAMLTLTESVCWDHRGASSEGTAIKQVCFVARRADVNRAEFERRYSAHAEIVRAHHPAVTRYVQNIVVDSQGEGVAAIEAISELWFDSVDDYCERYYAHDISPDIVRTDVTDYLDFTRGFNVMMEPTASSRAWRQ